MGVMNGARWRRGLAWLGAAAVVALAGCGGTSGTTAGRPTAPAASPASVPAVAAATLAAQMKRAVKSARSVHVFGHLVSGGQVIGIDIGVLRSGQLSGTITRQGVPLRFVITGGKAYIRATAGFLRQLRLPASVCATICGRYVRLPAARTRALTRSLSLAGLTSSLTGPTTLLRDAGVTTVHGQRADVLRTADGGVIEVTAGGSHFPVAAKSPGGRRGALTFTQWNSVPVPAAPPKDQIVDPGQLG
jgi:hypothetical protein